MALKTSIAFLTGLLVLCGAVPSALAYPTSVVFVPTGDSRDFLQVGAFVYGAMNYRARDPGTREIGTALSLTWVSVNAGVVPPFSYGGGVGFGGLEVGANLSAPDLRGRSQIMPLFDVKASVLTQGEYHPALAVGLIGLSPLKDQIFNFGYVAVTKTLKWGAGPSYGRVTLGAGRAFVPVSQTYPRCTSSGEPCALRGAPPFEDTNFAPMLGYETPAFGRLSFGIDHLGGTSLISSTNVIANLQMAEGAFFSLGAWFSNDRRDAVTGGTVADGLFALVSIAADARSLLTPIAASPPAAPAAPATPAPPEPTAPPEPAPAPVAPPAAGGS